jgi:predicted component of type VI protein secretion system
MFLRFTFFVTLGGAIGAREHFWRSDDRGETMQGVRPLAQLRDAEIALRGGVCVIRDLGSSNGTWVNGRPIRSRARLRRGDELRLGETVIRVR